MMMRGSTTVCQTLSPLLSPSSAALQPASCSRLQLMRVRAAASLTSLAAGYALPARRAHRHVLLVMEVQDDLARLVGTPRAEPCQACGPRQGVCGAVGACSDVHSCSAAAA